MKSRRIAFMPLVRTTFDVPFANQMISSARDALLKAGFDLVETPAPISDQSTADEAARMLQNQTVDALLVFQATFADSTLVTTLAEAADAPIFLWAVPEPWTGSRLRLNSLCGINLAAHALRLREIKFDYAYCSADDPQILKKLNKISAVGALLRRLKTARMGVVGEHPAGMDSCHLDQDQLLETFGIHIEKIDLQAVFARARTIKTAQLASVRADLDEKLDNLTELNQPALNNTLRVYQTLHDLADELALDGLAVRCWPEFFTEMGCAACGAMSMLSDGFSGQKLMPCSCEADINGTITQWILQSLSNSPTFGTDMVGVDVDQDVIALWHCGLAPLSMAHPDEQPRGTIHSNRQLPLLMDFRLKPGPVTFARISQADGRLRLVIGEGQMLDAPKPFSGTAGTLKPDCSAKYFLDSLMHQGLEHHISMTYGRYASELKMLAEWINLPVFMMDDQEVSI
jgi:L-fucose isomerase-like protein